MDEPTMERALTSQQLDDHVRQTALSDGAAAKIDKAKQLLDNGAVRRADFDTIRRTRLLDEARRSARLRPKTLINARWCLHERLPGGV